MEVIIGMFRELARLGVSRAAAFFYAVAVGVAANIIIAHFAPQGGIASAPLTTWPIVPKPDQSPEATAVITPRAAEPPAHALDVSAPATLPMPSPATKPAILPAINAAAPPPAPAIKTALPANSPAPLSGSAPAAASLPNPATMAPPPLQPTALPSATTAATSPAPADAKPADKPANNVEAASATPAAPVSLLPPSDQPAPKPIKPGPGSGGLY